MWVGMKNDDCLTMKKEILKKTIENKYKDLNSQELNSIRMKANSLDFNKPYVSEFQFLFCGF